MIDEGWLPGHLSFPAAAPIAEYEREDYQSRALLEMRILAAHGGCRSQ